MPDDFPVPHGSKRHDQRRRFVSILIVALLVITIGIQFGGFVYTTTQHEALNELRSEMRDMRALQRALFEAEDSVGDYVISSEESHLQRYFVAIHDLRGARSTTIPRLQPATQAAPFHPRASPAVLATDNVIASWNAAIGLMRESRRDEALQTLRGAAHTRLMNIRSAIDGYLERAEREAGDYEERDALGGKLAAALQLIGGMLTLGVLIMAFRSSGVETRARRAAVVQATSAHAQAVAAHEQVERLFRMTDMLQSASGYADANAVLKATTDGLLPDFGCSLYVFNNSRDRLDLSSAWNLPEGHAPAETVSPLACWALKRGKPHLNSAAGATLRCDHQSIDCAVLEIPMMARGEVFGLLSFYVTGPDAETRIEDVTGVTMALADAMSLALSNISLREKLKNQALRDPLTGLYNRRYLEDMLERFMVLSERSSRPMSIIMIDLDHFKRLNDEHGHAVGDAVLRDSAEAILGALRQSDVACRYGGEELTVLLPDTGLEEALAKAEILRARIESLSQVHGTRITASFGVAAYPDTSANVGGLMTMADGALYEAKHAGRNRVVAAELRRIADPVRQNDGTPLLDAAE